MLVRHSTKKFNINTNIQHNSQDIISDKAKDVIKTKEVNLSLNVFDSDESNIDMKPVLVLIHGNSSSQKIWRSSIEHFENYRIIAIDLLGHGESTKICDIDNLNESEKELLSSEFYNPLAMIKELEQVFEAKRIEQAYIIGWSLGGHLAYGIAADNPDYVSKLITIGSPPVRFSKEGFKEGFQEWFVTKLLPEWIENPQKFSEQMATSIAESMHFAHDKDFVSDLMTTDPGIRKYLFVNLEKYDHSFFNVLDGKNWVTTTNKPLCLMVGENDAGISSGYIGLFSEKLKNESSKIKVIKEAGHLLFKSHEDKFYRNVNKFFSGKNQMLKNEEPKPATIKSIQ